jgi:polyphosphate glucokinase
MRTLCIDIGGTGIKAIIADEGGVALTERGRIETPSPATPDAVLEVIAALASAQGEFDRVSVGFPGVVLGRTIKRTHNLDVSFAGFDLGSAVEQRLGKPARLANDALIQGLAVIEGKGFEVAITLGTGLGCGLYIDGKQAGCEIAHHPLRKGKTYEDLVGNAARRKVGKKKWNKRVLHVIEQLAATFNYRRLYIGGGNVKHLDRERLPDNAQVVDNVAGMLGGVRLWA